MQLNLLERTHKISNNKFFCFDKSNKDPYILTIQPPSEFNRMLYSLNHSNLLLVSEYWEERGQICSVQRCESLNEINEVPSCILEIVQNNKLSENLILSILYQITLAMYYLEQEQIPVTVTANNVFLDDKLQVKIDVLNIVNAPLQYASPEVLRKETEQSGIWSVGCLAYFMMKGDMPFQGANERSVAYNIIYKEPPPCDFQEFPLISAILKVIFIKNSKRRVGTRQVLQFLASKSANHPEQVRLNRCGRSSHQVTRNSNLLSKIDKFSEKQSESMKIDQSPKILTLQEFEEQQSRLMKGRPQSSVVDESREIIQRIQRMRPNSAISLTGKEFITKNIKEEMSNRRLVNSSQPIPRKKEQQKNHNEISVDLDDVRRLKHSDTIRVYNLEYKDAATFPNKQNKVFLKVLHPKLVSAKEYPKEQLQGINKWRNKMNSLLN